MRPISTVAFVAITALIAQAAIQKSEVTEVAANGFQIKMTIPCEAKPDVVYACFVDHIGDWWDKSHTYTNNSKNLTIDARPHGWLSETLPNGGFVRHFEIVYLAPNKTIRLEGGMGPLQDQGVAGSMTIHFKPSSDGTSTIDLTYNVGGFMPGGENTMKQWAPVVKQVITGQMECLRDYAEKSSKHTND